jgi:hypothetical protein
MEPLKVETVASPDQLMPMAMVCVMALLVIFVLLALVRMWCQQMQKKGGGCGGLDVEALRRQRDSGEITQEEFDRILRPAKAGPEENPQQPPIKNTGEPA